LANQFMEKILSHNRIHIWHWSVARTGQAGQAPSTTSAPVMHRHRRIIGVQAERESNCAARA
jgi:hypothetical protein